MKRIFAIPLMLLALAGCANTTPRQIIDMRGVEPGRYYQDKAECDAYAEQVGIGGAAVDNAAGGALLGAIIGGLLGGKDGAKFGAGYFATTGALEGAAGAARDKQQVAARCMAGRGYSVLR